MLFTSHAVKLITRQAKIHAAYHPPGMYLYIFQIDVYACMMISATFAHNWEHSLVHW